MIKSQACLSSDEEQVYYEDDKQYSGLLTEED